MDTTPSPVAEQTGTAFCSLSNSHRTYAVEMMVGALSAPTIIQTPGFLH